MPPPSFDSILNPTPTPNLLVRVKNNATEEDDSSVPFETALQRLSATLNEAVSFFNQLDHSFKEDTRSITLYAKSPVLDKIWRSKVAAVRQSHYHHYQQQQPLCLTKAGCYIVLSCKKFYCIGIASLKLACFQ